MAAKKKQSKRVTGREVAEGWHHHHQQHHKSINSLIEFSYMLIICGDPTAVFAVDIMRLMCSKVNTKGWHKRTNTKWNEKTEAQKKSTRKPAENLMGKCLWELVVKRRWCSAIFLYALISERRVARLRLKTQLKIKEKNDRGRGTGKTLGKSASCGLNIVRGCGRGQLAFCHKY